MHTVTQYEIKNSNNSNQRVIISVQMFDNLIGNHGILESGVNEIFIGDLHSDYYNSVHLLA